MLKLSGKGLKETINSRSCAFFPLWKRGIDCFLSTFSYSGIIESIGTVVVPTISPSKLSSLTI